MDFILLEASIKMVRQSGPPVRTKNTRGENLFFLELICIKRDIPAGRKIKEDNSIWKARCGRGTQSSLTQRTKGPEKESTGNSNTLRYSRGGSVTMLEAHADPDIQAVLCVKFMES